MFVFTVKDMRVSGQADAVLAAVKHVDENASVLVNLWSQEVQISPTTVGATELSDAIIHAGFAPVLRNDSGRTVHMRWQVPRRIPFVRLDTFSALSTAAPTVPGEETADSEGDSVSPAL